MSSGADFEVCAALPLRIEAVTAQSRSQQLNSALLGPAPEIDRGARPLFERQDPIVQLAGRIEAIERKVDALLAIMLRMERQQGGVARVPTTLCSEGIGFVWPEEVAPGSELYLELPLGAFPPIELCCVVKVERCEAREDASYSVWGRFEAISEGGRDDLHRFMLASQRHVRRTRRGEG